jgi:hypothetical protein
LANFLHGVLLRITFVTRKQNIKMESLRMVFETRLAAAHAEYKLCQLRLRLFDYLTSSEHIALPGIQAMEMIGRGEFNSLRQRIAKISPEMANEFDSLFFI